jgi:hypothetical protein
MDGQAAVLPVFYPYPHLLQSMARGQAILAGQETAHKDGIICDRSQ